MARTPFKLRSGNTTPFKMMGSSSPLHQNGTETNKERRKRHKKERKNLKIEQKIEKLKDKLGTPKETADPVGTETLPVLPPTEEGTEETIQSVEPPKVELPKGEPIGPPKKKDPPKLKPPEKGKPAPPEKRRPTSWLRGEEGWIPDELQPHVNRPDVKDEGKSIFESLKDKLKAGNTKKVTQIETMRNRWTGKK